MTNPRIEQKILVPTPLQDAWLRVPQEHNLLVEGGRGSAKTTFLRMEAYRHHAEVGEDAYSVVFRTTYKASSQLEDDFAMELQHLWPGTKHNRAEHTFRVPGAGKIEIAQLDKPTDLAKFQGRSITRLIVDEYTTFPTSRWLKRLKANLRGRAGIPLRVVLACNPGGNLHSEVLREFIQKAPQWVPFTNEEGESWVHAGGSWRDNPHLGPGYQGSLRAAAAGDEGYFRAMDSGDWTAMQGTSFLGDVLAADSHMLQGWPHPVTDAHRPFVSLDWGSSSPSVAFLCLTTTGDELGFPAGSLMLVDELATNAPHSLEEGLRWPPQKLAEHIKDMASRWGVKRVRGVGDDAYGLQNDSVLEVLRRHGLHLVKPRKSRVAGWQALRQLLFNASERNGAPGMWISKRCEGFWETAPHIERDPFRPEDIRSGGADHWLDAARYAVQYRMRPQSGSGTHRGMY